MLQSLHSAVIALLALSVVAPSAMAQQSKPPVGQPAPAAAFDAGAVRRRAAQVAELKALLADPNANIRLVAIQDAVASGDPTLRDIAIEAGLASNETAMVNAALRGTLMGRDSLLIRYNDGRDREKTDKANATFILMIRNYNAISGKIDGTSNCGPGADPGDWTGLASGPSISFTTKNLYCSGRLTWDADTGSFGGTGKVISLNGERPMEWKPF